MIQIMSYEDNFFELEEKNKGKVIVYGAGTAGKKAISYISNITCFCDKEAKSKRQFYNYEVVLPEKLCVLKGKLNIVIAVNRKQEVFEHICDELKKLNINAYIFNLYNNIAFDFQSDKYTYAVNFLEQKFSVNLVNYDDGWICSKFAQKLKDNLQEMDIKVQISDVRDWKADINHHIPYHHFEAIVPTNDTTMITHVDTLQKLNLIKKQVMNSRMGICMSKETMEKLACWNIPRHKLCYINPAHDAQIKPKKYVLGITHKCHDNIDYRKNIQVLLEICKVIDPQYFRFKIMGMGWDKVVEEMRKMNFEVEYYDDFYYEIYTELMPTLDYYLFFGYDEGSMGYLDALTAGVKTIVTPQGYHLDAYHGITHPCETIEQFIWELSKLERERKELVQSVENWTWDNYAKKHLEVWHYLTKRKNLKQILLNKHKYNDGIFSILMDDMYI